MEADWTLVGARAVNERHCTSKEVYFGSDILRANLLLKMKPVPPPRLVDEGSGKY